MTFTNDMTLMYCILPCKHWWLLPIENGRVEARKANREPVAEGPERLPCIKILPKEGYTSRYLKLGKLSIKVGNQRCFGVQRLILSSSWAGLWEV